MANAEIEWRELRERVGTVFTPAASIQTRELFAGRIDQLELLAETIDEVGRRAIVHGERGVGKTSMANILGEIFPTLLVVRVAVDSTDTYQTLWRKVFRRIRLVRERQGAGFTGEVDARVSRLADMVQLADIDPDQVVTTMDDIGVQVVVVIDEFDRLESQRAKRLVADTIKSFSDVASRATVILVGVARSVTELIGEHPSVERNLRQIPMQRMSKAELTEILTKGFGELGMDLPDALLRRIVGLSQGFPHYTHLMGKYCALQAIDAEALEVVQDDFELALDSAVNDTYESIRSAYQTATVTTRTESIFPAVLLASAVAPEDEHGTFRATDLVAPMRDITGKDYDVSNFTYNLGKLTTEERGNVLETVGGPRRPRYRFANPLMKPYILMKGINDGLIDESLLASLTGHGGLSK